MAANPSPNEVPVAANPIPNEAAAASRIAMQPVTGTFADPSDRERLLDEVQHPIDDDSRSLFGGRMTELIPRDAPQSEDDPDIEAAAMSGVATPIAMHPVTGAFADPTHELAFAAHFFRLCFGGHMVSMALIVFTPAWAALSGAIPTDSKNLLPFAFFVLVGLLGQISRVRIHQWDDTVRAQRMGARIWTALMALNMATDFLELMFSKAASCKDVASITASIYCSIWMVWLVLLTGSHGMSFTHKFGLTCALTLDPFLLMSACGLGLAPYPALAGASLAVFGMAHLAEMHVRHSYANTQRLEVQMNAKAEESRRLEERNEQLRAEKERLMYDMQRRGNPLDDVDARTAIRRGLLAGPCHSSHTSDAGYPGPSDSLPASLPPGPPSSNSSGPAEAPAVGSALSWVEADRPKSATTAESVYDELERALADVAESERTPATGTVEETMSRLHRAIWLADRPNQEQHLLARCGCASSCSSQAGQQEAAVLRINVNASPRLNPSALRQKFDELVMCDFTPRHPKDLPTSQWVSYPRLARLFEPHAPDEVWHKGPGNLRQLIIEWYKDDPTFAGLAPNAWCKRVKSTNDPQEHPESGTSRIHVYKFCFEYTPRGSSPACERPWALA